MSSLSSPVATERLDQLDPPTPSPPHHRWRHAATLPGGQSRARMTTCSTTLTCPFPSLSSFSSCSPCRRALAGVRRCLAAARGRPEQIGAGQKTRLVAIFAGVPGIGPRRPLPHARRRSFPPRSAASEHHCAAVRSSPPSPRTPT